MDEERLRSRARVIFHVALLAFLFPPFLPMVWLLAVRNADGRPWGRRTFALAACDTVLLAGLAWLALSGGLARIDLGEKRGPPVIGVIGGEDSEERGATIAAVLPGSPAEEAGLLPGDVIVAAGSRRIEDLDDLSSIVSSSSVGQPLSLRVRRGRDELEITVVPRSVAGMEPALLERTHSCSDLESRPLRLNGAAFASVILLPLFLHARIRRARYRGAWLAILPLIIASGAAAVGTLYGVCLTTGKVGQGTLLLGILAQQMVMLVGGIALLLWFGRHRMLTLLVPPRLSEARTLALGSFYAFAGMMRVTALVVVVIALFPGAAAASGDIIERVPSEVPLSLAALFIVQALLLAPLTEEVIFRGILLPGLSHQVRPAWAVVLTALVFGVMHIPTHGVRAIGPAFLGAILGWQRIRSGGLAAPILLHAISNGFALIALAGR